MKNTHSTYFVEMKDVTKTVGFGARETTILHEVTFSARPGEFVLILGPSGSGKSTFLTILAGLQAPTGGQVCIFGRDLKTYSGSELQTIRAEKIGFVFQTFNLIDTLTALENVLLVTRFTKIPNKQARQKALELLEAFEIEHLADSLPKQMSQGENQRVALARALVNGASLILADEPTGSLSSEQGFAIMKLLKSLTEQHAHTVIVVSHDQRLSQLSDRTLMMIDGKLTENLEDKT